MRVSAPTARMLAKLREMFSSDVVNEVLAAAELKAIARGGRQITRADWDAAEEDLRAEMEERIEAKIAQMD